MRTDKDRALTMEAPEWGTDERGLFIEGRVRRKPERYVPFNPSEIVRPGSEALGTHTDTPSEPRVERIHVADVRVLRQEPERLPPSEWPKAVFMFGVFATEVGLLVSVFV
jgi:hypothetical protein